MTHHHWLVAAGQLPAFRRRIAHARETVGEGAAVLEAGGISLHVRDRIVREGKVARQVISFLVRDRIVREGKVARQVILFLMRDCIVREGTAKLEVKSRDRRQSDGESKDPGRANHVRGRAVLERRAADPFWVASQLKWGGAASFVETRETGRTRGIKSSALTRPRVPPPHPHAPPASRRDSDDCATARYAL